MAKPPLNRLYPQPQLPPMPEVYRELFAAAVDDVDTWLVYVALAGMPVMDDDLSDPSTGHQQDWFREALVGRIGWPAVVEMLDHPEAREALYERGPAATARRPSGETVPRPITRQQIDSVLDHLDWCLRNVRTSPSSGT